MQYTSDTRTRVQQIQENFVTYFRLFAGLPGIVFQEGDIVWAVTDQGAPGSHVLGAKLSGDTVDACILEALCQIGAQTDAFDWLVFPTCQPADLGARLKAIGEAGGPEGEWMLYGNIGVQPGTWMVIDLTELAAGPPVADGFHVRQVVDQTLFDVWTEINARGFGSSDYSKFHAAYSRHGFGADAQAIHFIGYLDEEPVTSSTLLVAGGCVSVYNVSTPTDLRRQGFGSAITRAALQHAQSLGYRSSWIWSSNLGRGVYTKLGYVITDLGIREFQWRKRSPTAVGSK